MRTRSRHCRHASMIVACALVCVGVHAAPATPTDGSVTLAPASAAASGIETAPLTESRYAPQVRGIATVLDPQPLLALAANLQTAHATFVATKAQARAAAAEATRATALHRNGDNTSLREVQAAAAATAAAQAKQVAAAADARATRGSARVQWGATLAGEAEHGSHSFDAMAEGSTALLAVALPPGSAAPAGRTIHVRKADGEIVAATLIGPSPRADQVVQGPTYFYRANDAGLRIGQHLLASVPVRTSTRTGVIVPTTAVIWYAGQPWAYVEISAGHFQRRLVAETARTAKGWFESSGFRVGERVVVRGGELLLSKELLPPPGAQPAASDDD